MVYPLEKISLGNLINLYIKKIEGTENFPKSPFIVASNHASYADDVFVPYLIISTLNKKFHIFVNSRFYKNFFLKAYLDYHECIPVDVSKDVKDDKIRKATNEKAFKTASRYLKKGDIFAIFPEGSRSKDGKLKKAKTGVAKMALLSKLPVVPIGILGSYDIMPKGAIFPRFKRATIKIGKPLYFKGNKDYKTLEKITTTIMKEIAKLTNQKWHIK